jgi:hypothetical protein
MDHSLNQTVSLTCSHCRQNFDAVIWLIIDSSTHPELLERVRAGDLHNTPCPHCHHTGQVDAPLLLYRPSAETPLIFSPAQQTSQEEDQEQAQGLLRLLHERLGPAWQDSWLESLPALPRPLLPALLDGDPEAARQMAETATQSEDTSEKQLPPPEGVDPAQAQALANSLVAWIQQKTLADAEMYLNEHQGNLLTDAAQSAMTWLVQTNPRNPNIAEHQTRLARAREAGIEVMYAEIRRQRFLESMANLPPTIREIFNELTAGGAEINSPEDFERLLAERPDLQARLVAAGGQSGSVDIPPQFQTDWQ